MTTRAWYAWAMVTMAVVPTGARAQTAPNAATLEADAMTLTESPSDLGKAAELYREAAALRPTGDPIALKDLVLAARYSFYAGKHDRALRYFASAAETALRYGDVLAAAESFLDAAWVAQQVRDGSQALHFATRARELSSSPLLRETDRARLLSRLPG